MRMNKALIACVQFARFSQQQGLDPVDLAELIALANKAFHAGERECNTNRSADKERQAFEDKAKELGYGCHWDSLAPRLTKDNRDIYLPCV